MNGCLTLCDSIIHQASQSFIWVSQYFILSGSELKKRFPYFFKATMPDPIFSQLPRSLWLRFGRRWMAPRFCPRSDLELRAGGLKWRLARWHQARRHEGLKYASSFPSQPPSLPTRAAPANVLHLATEFENIAERYLIQNTTPLYLKSVLPWFINEDLHAAY